MSELAKKATRKDLRKLRKSLGRIDAAVERAALAKARAAKPAPRGMAARPAAARSPWEGAAIAKAAEHDLLVRQAEAILAKGTGSADLRRGAVEFLAGATGMHESDIIARAGSR